MAKKSKRVLRKRPASRASAAPKPSAAPRVSAAKQRRAKPGPAGTLNVALHDDAGQAAAEGGGETQSRLVVGVGASAGGLEAFSQLLRHLPTDTGMAFVLVQHLDPKHESLLSELLSRTTRMPVTQVTDGIKVEPNRVYVIPPNAHMGIVKGVLRLKARSDLGHYMPIDYFLLSLADDQGSRAIGVILSGTASDGTLGMKAIKAGGGITFAQDRESAKYDGMPRSAVAAGCVDFVLPPQGIARELASVASHPYLLHPRATPPDEFPPESDGDFKKILSLLRLTTGVDFTHYKHGTIRRRIRRRMVLGGMENLSDYLHHLREDAGEIHALYHDMLISVTAFFREPDAFQSLRKRVFPAILKGRPQGAPVRLWVPGCATGEEAYSIAICLLETFEDTKTDFPIQIFATDISEPAIERARQGIYPAAIARYVSPERLRRFFVKVDGGYQITRSLREMCVFAKHDVTRDPPFSRLDLISCRNVLIYLGPVLQKRVLAIFHYALQPSGLLALGASEAISTSHELFALTDRKRRVYTRKPAETRLHFGLPFGERRAQEVLGPPRLHVEPPPGSDLQKEADRVVLGQYAPPGVVVDSDMRIVQFRGQTSPYLEPAPGEASFHLFRMARPDLAAQLRRAIQQVGSKNTRIRREGLRVERGGQLRDVNLEVVPLRAAGSKERYYLVLFEDAASPAGEPAEAPSGSAPADGAAKSPRRQAPPQVLHLKQELAATKQHLQAIIEEQEAGVEELKSANEEIQSSNEELQSTNEELETAKEELQSANEELTTVNEELLNRNLELGQANNDLSNLLASTNIPIVMLGNDLCIRRFTPMAESVLSLIPTDIGRPVTDLRPNVELPDLENRIQEVIQTLRIQKFDVQDRQGRWHTMWIRPYRTVENKIDGAVIALVDIDDLKRSLEQLQESRDYATAIVDTVPTSVIVLDRDLRVKAANQSFYKTFALSPPEAENRALLDLDEGQWNIPGLRPLLDDVLVNSTRFQHFEVEHAFPRVGRKTLLVSARGIDPQGGGMDVLLAIEDITERRAAEAELRSTEQRFGQIAESMRDVFYIRDVKSNRTLYVSPAYETIWGRTIESLYESPGSWMEAVHPDDRLRVAEAGRINLGRQYRIEHRIMRPDGTVRWVLVRASPVLDERGEVHRIAGVAEDVTERKQLEEQFRQAQKMEAIGRLAGGLAHDFNNLLTAIEGYSELLLEDMDPPDPRRGPVEQIQQATLRAAGLTRQILAFSRRQLLQLEVLDLNALVEGMGRMLAPLIGEDIELSTVLAPDLEAVRADPGQMEQVILNLAVNARDAMPEGGRLTIETANADLGNGRQVMLMVTDTGSGMDAETQSHLFEPFFTTKPQGKGTGLGLSTVYGIVKQSGGEIMVSSDLGRGSKFTVCLPAVSEPVAPVWPRPEAVAMIQGSETILLVEDEEAVRTLARKILGRNGYNVLEACDAEEALTACAQYAAPIHL
ncbi:MAG TPA: chemotaxis protein CheB, partial [Bryobacterales bacterium]|nr:chemotaxis protein CheB [Bryobacterales bacterium]